MLLYQHLLRVGHPPSEIPHVAYTNYVSSA